VSGPHPAVAEVRRAVRNLLADCPELPGIDVAVSGGADSLALTEAAVFTGCKLGLPVRALVVDHGLQEGSARVAAEAAAVACELGVDSAEVLAVEVTGPGGTEAAARNARYAALREQRRGIVLLGHTRDDQAETVLLGLGRGSGPRSIAGMRAVDLPWGRPLLKVARATTREACRALGLTPWEDPHNSDPRFTRVRLRAEVLPLLEDVLGGGVAAALARTAAQLREDSEALDALAAGFLARHGKPDIEALTPLPASLRRRILRAWLRAGGARELTDAHLRSVDALVGEWRGQGGVWLPGGLVVTRTHGRLAMNPPETRGD
jgi:tRNA(Ile)-lysidine synthase